MTTDLTGCFLGYDPGGNDRHGVAAIRVVSGIVLSAACDTAQTTGRALRWFLDRMARKAIKCGESSKPEFGPVEGIGIDTLTYWSSGKSGWRKADQHLAERYGAVRNSVATPNSLYSAMSVNGIFVLRKLRKRVDMYATETHPKVLYFALQPAGKKNKYRYPEEPTKPARPKRNESAEEFTRRRDVDYPRRLEEFRRCRQAMNQFLADAIHLPSGDAESADLTENSHEWDALISAWAAFQARSEAWKMDLVRFDKEASPDDLDFPAGCVAYGWPGPIGEIARRDTTS